MNKSSIVTLIVVAIIAISPQFFLKPAVINVSPTPVMVNVPEQKTPIVNVGAPAVNIPATIVNVPKQVSPVSPVLGSVTGPDSYFPYIGSNNLRTYSVRNGLATATNTPCAIPSPKTATSTLTFGSIKFLVSSTTATRIEIGQATTPYATTTLIGTALDIAANAQATVIASTSPTGTATIFAPGTFLVIKTQGGATNSYSPTGICEAEFKEI